MTRLRAKAFKLTDDNWHDNYTLAESSNYLENRTRLVEVSLLSLGPKLTDQTRVCVWGNDDCGMERDFDNQADATTCFMDVLTQPVVNKKWLKSIGFWPA
jgi:hypothetical protein